MKSGDIAVDLARPMDLQLSWWARDLGRAGFQLITRGLAPLLIGALAIGLAAPGSWTAYPSGVVSLMLGVSISLPAVTWSTWSRSGPWRSAALSVCTSS